MKGPVPVAGKPHFSAVRHTSDKRGNSSDANDEAESKTCTNHRHHGVRQPFMFHYSGVVGCVIAAAGPTTGRIVIFCGFLLLSVV
jgi:hypothetical protein